MSLLLAAIAAHPDTPPHVLTALADAVRRAHATTRLPWGHPMVTTAAHLIANPNTPEAVAADLPLATSFADHLLDVFTAITVAGAPASRHDMVAAQADPEALAGIGFSMPLAPAPALRAALASCTRELGELDPMDAFMFTDQPHLTPDDAAIVVRAALSAPDHAYARQAVTTATRRLPARLADLAAVAVDPAARADLARYAAVAATGADPHAERMTDLLATARTDHPDAPAAARAVATDPTSDPAVVADLLVRPTTRAPVGEPGLVRDILANPHLHATTAAWTAATPAHLRAGTPVATADDALAALAQVAHSTPMLLRAVTDVLPYARDPQALAAWSTARRVAGDTTAAFALAVHPVTDPVTRQRAARLLTDDGHDLHPALLAAGEPGGMGHLPVAVLRPLNVQRWQTRVLCHALNPTLAHVLPALGTPTAVEVFLALEPTFPGTIAELTATARAILT